METELVALGLVAVGVLVLAVLAVVVIRHVRRLARTRAAARADVARRVARLTEIAHTTRLAD